MCPESTWCAQLALFCAGECSCGTLPPATEPQSSAYIRRSLQSDLCQLLYFCALRWHGAIKSSLSGIGDVACHISIVLLQQYCFWDIWHCMATHWTRGMHAILWSEFDLVWFVAFDQAEASVMYVEIFPSFHISSSQSWAAQVEPVSCCKKGICSWLEVCTSSSGNYWVADDTLPWWLAEKVTRYWREWCNEPMLGYWEFRIMPLVQTLQKAMA